MARKRTYFISYRYYVEESTGFGHQVQDVDKELKFSITKAAELIEKKLVSKGYTNPKVIVLFFKEMKSYEE